MDDTPPRWNLTMHRDPYALFAEQHGVVGHDQLVAAGFSRQAMKRRVESGSWTIAAPRVYRSEAHERSWEQRLWVAVLWAGGDVQLSHRAAGALWELDRIAAGAVVATVPRARRLRGGPAVVHRADLDECDRRTVRGFPVTAPERTVIDLAGELDEHTADDVVESAFRLGLTTPGKLLGRVDALAAPGRAGIARTRRLLERRGFGRPRGSVLEGRFERLLLAAGLPLPVRQHEVVLGSHRYFLDFAYPDVRVMIELDGWEARGRRDTFETDRSRQNRLTLAGWTPLRFTARALHERPHEVVGAIATAVRCAS